MRPGRREEGAAVVGFGRVTRDARGLLAWASLAGGVVAALAVLLSVVQPVAAQSAECPAEAESLTVPGAERQDPYCLPDLTTKGLVDGVHTDRSEWGPSRSAGALNPPEPVPGVQINGCFPDDSDTNTNNSCEHDAQFVLRLPDDWNGKLVVTGATGILEQYSNDFFISDWVLSKGYAFAATDKGNMGGAFYEDGERPGDAVAEWHRRLEQLTVATKKTVKQRYGKAPKRTYVTGFSNGGYLTRYALENTPRLYDGGVDWEGTLFRAQGPNLFTYLPVALREYPECESGDRSACRAMYGAGFEPGSEFLWRDHYGVFWDLTQRVYREEFDPLYDGDVKAGSPPGPFCQDEANLPGCDANYVYEQRPKRVKDAVGRVSNTGEIGKPMLTLHGTLDTLLPIGTDSDVYSKLVRDAGNGGLHRYYRVEEGTHLDSYYDVYPDRLRPILPCYRAAFEELEEWVEAGNKPPKSKLVRKPDSGDVANSCSLGRGASYSAAGG